MGGGHHALIQRFQADTIPEIVGSAIRYITVLALEVISLFSLAARFGIVI